MISDFKKSIILNSDKAEYKFSSSEPVTYPELVRVSVAVAMLFGLS